MRGNIDSFSRVKDSLLNRRFVWKNSETQDSIYGRVGLCISHSNVNRLDKNSFVISRRFVILAFDCSCCHAILIGLERRLLIGGPMDHRRA